jgi:hypothetical protein
MEVRQLPEARAVATADPPPCRLAAYRVRNEMMRFRSWNSFHGRKRIRT